MSGFRAAVVSAAAAVATSLSGCGGGDAPRDTDELTPAATLERFLSLYGNRSFEAACALLQSSASVIIGFNTRGDAEPLAAPANCRELLVRVFELDEHRPKRLAALRVSQTTILATDRVQLSTAAGRWELVKQPNGWKLSSINPLVADVPT